MTLHICYHQNSSSPPKVYCVKIIHAPNTCYDVHGFCRHLNKCTLRRGWFYMLYSLFESPLTPRLTTQFRWNLKLQFPKKSGFLSDYSGRCKRSAWIENQQGLTLPSEYLWELTGPYTLTLRSFILHTHLGICVHRPHHPFQSLEGLI